MHISNEWRSGRRNTSHSVSYVFVWIYVYISVSFCDLFINVAAATAATGACSRCSTASTHAPQNIIHPYSVLLTTMRNVAKQKRKINIFFFSCEPYSRSWTDLRTFREALYELKYVYIESSKQKHKNFE